ncbi:IclR family transcriptional regulator [Streptomyces sp. NPDC002962]|uniref:IclR family transcriptional regulator n=1 Tax=Streptomyces sp. NPDC002962 TaxID=3364674 RepID=UPI0036A48F94
MTPPEAAAGQTTPTGQGPKPPVGEAVIDRAFRLLNSFDAEHRVQSLADLARRAGIPRSSTLRLARKLVDAGALERLEDGDFVIGLGLLEVASLAPRGHGLRAVAMPYMEDLFHVTRHHVLLGVRDGDDALLVERLSAHDAAPVRFRVGGRMPLAATGVGLVLLAHAPAELQEKVLNDFAPQGEMNLMEWDSAPELRRTLAEVRRGGFAVQREPGGTLSTVAAPVRDGGGVVAALSVVMPSSELAPGSYVTAVRTSARAISRQLGSSTREV